MATQEERLTTLERSFASFQKEAVANVVDINEKYIMLFGVVGSQGQDIKRILARLDTVDQRLGLVEHHLSVVDHRLESMEATLREHTSVLDEHTKRFDRVESLLTQILERLPK